MIEFSYLIFIVILINTLLLPFAKKNSVYCGIIGFSGNNKDSNFNKEIIKSLLIINFYERGKDSVGLFSPKNNIIKKALDIKDFLKENYNNVVEDNIFLGHVRKASSGQTNDKNAHPFLAGNIILVHNGTITNKWELSNKYDNNTICDTDSEELAHCINKDYQASKQEPEYKSLSLYKGTATVMWYNKDNEYLYVFKDKERELYYGLKDEGMYISSNRDALELSNCKDIKSFKDNYLCEIIDGKIIQETLIEEDQGYIRTINNNEIGNFIAGTTKNLPAGLTGSDQTYGVIGIFYKGFNIRYKGITVKPNYKNYGKKVGSFTKDKYYLCVDNSIEMEYRGLMLIDDNGETHYVETTQLDLTNFIPVSNRVAKSLFNLKDDKNKTVVFKNESVYINYFDRSKESKVEIMTLRGEIYDIDVKYIHTLPEHINKSALKLFTPDLFQKSKNSQSKKDIFEDLKTSIEKVDEDIINELFKEYNSNLDFHLMGLEKLLMRHSKEYSTLSNIRKIVNKCVNFNEVVDFIYKKD